MKPAAKVECFQSAVIQLSIVAAGKKSTKPTEDSSYNNGRFAV